MSLKLLLNPADRLVWIEYRLSTQEFCVSPESAGSDDWYFTADAGDAAATAVMMLACYGCAGVVYSKAAQDAARAQVDAVSANA